MTVAVIGAGVSGLCAALRLSEPGPGRVSDIVVLEKASRPGGLLQSAARDGYWWDHGGFIFYRFDFLARLMPDAFQPVEDLSTQVWGRGQFHNFPFGLKELLSSQPVAGLAAAALDYARSYVQRGLGLGGSSLHDWLRGRLPTRLLEQSQLETYFHKLQGHPTRELSPRLGEFRLESMVPLDNPLKLLRATLALAREAEKKTPVTPLYPSGPGVGTISERLAERCQDQGIRIRYGAEVRTLVPQGESGWDIAFDGESGPGRCQASHVISTIPLGELVAACRPHLSNRCTAAARKLAFVDLRLVFLIVRRPAIRHRHFVLYSFEPHHPWKRLVARALPGGLTSVLVEITFDPRAGEPAEDIIHTVIRDLTADLGLFKPEEIAFTHTTTVRQAYPIYDLGFERRVAAILQDLSSERLQTAGCQGQFLYVGTSPAIRTAIEAADRVRRTVSPADDDGEICSD